tara:strand:+ start:3808 stop:4452 length:645 start_codon:yes stop_codon:yes gene_type:complete
MYFCIYKITNNINGNFYIGAHKTDDLEDSYMGSGQLIKLAIKKHGIENFTREWMFKFNTPDEMWSKEREIVNSDLIKESYCYNIAVGGYGNISPAGSIASIKRINTVKRNGDIRRAKKEKEYNNKPKLCLECDNPIPWKTINNTNKKAKYCRQSCSASHQNKLRGLRNKSKYENNPKMCKHCDISITFETYKGANNKPVFCSNECNINHIHFMK